MEEEAEHRRYVDQLKAEFDSCDTTATGFLDRDELTELCKKLQLDAHLPLLLTLLLGAKEYGRVNFEEFKEGFVTVLSQSLDLSTPENSSSYVEPAVPEEVKPKFIKGAKRYGRRSHPDSKPDTSLTRDSEDLPRPRTEDMNSSPFGVRRAKLRRATSLESVESLKSDEETGSNRTAQQLFQSKGDPHGAEEEKSGGDPQFLTAGCDNLDMQDVLLQRLDPHLNGTVILREFRKVLSGSAPTSSSTPIRSDDLQRVSHKAHEVLDDVSTRFTSPSLLMATVGQRVLSWLDDGSGCTIPERVAALWTEEGIRNSLEILQTLDFPLEERLSLVDLTLALDNELLVSGNGIHQAALISYRTEIQHLQGVLEQACRERDKLRLELDLANQRNLQLVREVDDRHANMETLNESRIRDLEQDFHDRLTYLRSQSAQENEALLQEVDREQRLLQEELQLLREQEVVLQEELSSAAQENLRLQEELEAVKKKLKEAEYLVKQLQGDLKQLHHKFGNLDPTSTALSHDENVCEIIEEYERQCRELQDRNDELSSELEILKSQTSKRKSKLPLQDEADTSALSFTQQHTGSDSEESDMKRSSSPVVRKKLQPALSLLDGVSGPVVSIQTELAVEQLKEKHQQELQQLNIQLETQMNYYERQLGMIKDNMEVERKDISQAFKLEISELEEQRTQAEQQAKRLKESVDKLHTQIQHGGGGRSNDTERRMQRERAELEQNFAREIGNLVQRLSSEKDHLEAELKLKMDQEVMHVRTQLEEVRSENGALQERLRVLQQDVQNLEDDVVKKRRRLEEMGREHQRSREEEERLHKENSKYRQEVLDLSRRNLQLSNDNSDVSARLREEQESVRILQRRLETVSEEQEEQEAAVQRLQEAALQEKQLLEKELGFIQEELGRRSLLEAELSSVKEKLQLMEEEKRSQQRGAEDRTAKVETLQQQVISLQEEAKLLHSQLIAVTQEKLGHTQEVTELRRKLREADGKVEQLEADFHRLRKDEEDMNRVMVQNQELQQQLSELQVQDVQVQKQTQKQQNLKSRLNEVEAAWTQAQEQAVQADTALRVVKVQHLRQVQQLQQQVGSKEQVEVLHAQLEEESCKSRQLEEAMKLQVQQSTSQICVMQEQFEKATAALQQQVKELEVQLKGLRLVLQEKIQKLKEHLEKNNKMNGMLKDLYVENSQLMKALQVTEQRQKQAEKKNLLLEEKVGALRKLLREAVTTTLST